MACATVRGIVGILHEDTTGSVQTIFFCKNQRRGGVHRMNRGYATRIIPVNRCLHDRFHPVPNNSLLVRAKVMRLVLFVVDPESVTPRIQILVHRNLVPYDVNVAFDFRFL